MHEVHATQGDDGPLQPVSAHELELLALRRRIAELEAAAAADSHHPSGVLPNVRVVEIIEDGFIALDRDWRFSYVNSRAEQILDRSAQSLLGRFFWDEYPELINTATEREYRRVMVERTPGASVEFNTKLQRWFEGRYFPSPDGGVVAFFTDTTERRASEQAMRATEERLRLAQASSGFGTWYIDLTDPSNNYWSPESASLCGFDSSVVPGYDEWLKFVHPDDRDRVNRTIQQALVDRPGYTVVYRHLRADGEERWHEVHASILRRQDGTAPGVTGIVVDITDRMDSERFLRESEERWRSLANTLPQFLWVANSYGHAEFINQYFFEYTGLPQDSLSVEDWARVLHPDDLPVIARMWEKALETGSEQRFEYRVRRASDGEWRWHDGFHKPQCDDRGNILRWVGTAFDVHDRRRTEEELRRVEERQRLAVEAGDIGIWDWDAVTNRITWSDRMHEFHGVAPGEFGGTFDDFIRLVHPDDKDRMLAVVRESVAGPAPREVEFRTVRPSGDTRWLYTRAMPVTDELGTCIRMLGAVMDVTDSVLARQKLQSTRDRLSAIFEYAGDALFVSDSSGRYTEANEAACRLLGYTREELLGLTTRDLVNPEEFERLAEAWDAMASGRNYRGDWELLRKDRTPVPVEITGNTLPDGSVLGFVRDTSERMRLHQTAVRLASIVESSDDAIISTDLTSSILSWNAGAERIFGFSAAEAIGNDLSLIAVPGSTDIQDILDRIRSGERVDHYETVRRTKDGRDVDISLSVSPICDARGRVVGSSKIARDITEKKRAEQELRRNEQQLRFVLDQAPAFIAYIDRDFRYVRVNRAYEQWFGLPAAQILGKHVREAFGDEYFESVIPRLHQALAGETVSFDADAVCPRTGESHEMWVTYNPDQDANGRVHGLIALLHDVTERNLQQRLIRERDAELQRLLAALPDIIERFDSELRITYISPAAVRFTGSPTDYFIGKTHQELGIPSGLAELRRVSLQAVLDTGEPQTSEFEFLSPVLGSRRLLSLNIPERDDTGTVRGAMSIIRDITEQRRAEQDREDLLEREKQARETAELLNRVGPTLAAELDPDRLVQSVTDIATQLVGAEFGSLFHNVTDAAGESYLLYTLSGVSREAFAGFPMPRNTEVFGPTFRGEGLVRSDDITADPRYGKLAPHHGMPKGHVPVRSYLAAPVTSRSGEVLGGLFFGHSKPRQFTERHEAILLGIAAQSAIALDNALLFDRSQKIQDELRRSNEELRRVNKDLETFAYSASHDLQEPLRMVSISAQLLARRGGDLPDETRGFLANIHEGASRMRTLLGDLLSYTRAIRQADGTVSVVSAEEVLAKVLDNLCSSINESGAVVTHEPLPPVRMMEVHLTQILQNLIGNALKYRRAEAPLVHISAVARDGFVIISVADNGIGIDPRFRDQIFGLFKRLHTREEYPGSGVGLAICQRVIEQYGGQIWVEGQASGHGSIFHFSVPAA